MSEYKGFTLAGGFCGAWQGASPNAVSEQSVDDCEPAIIQESGFSVARNEMECAKVTTKRNERNFLKKFLKWSYQVVTARKIQESEIPDGRSAQREVSVSESRNEQKAKALRMTGLSAKEFQDSGFCGAWQGASPNIVR